MKISGHTPYAKIESTRAGERGPAEGRESSEASPTGAAAEVRMSDAARAMRDAHAPERPDEAKVARLRELVERGDFQIDAERIASAMLDEER
ncbi:MAG TPA: flagellar biosynthesis anti-sigma factor FlgM [Sandaracinaceae bacterium LLY-WYZ-13_1]|nr:flagellar biosynthesis anti-sigma factor FlgM [Sandaracinaceae bacterium LLY-WYZ-13_1]